MSFTSKLLLVSNWKANCNNIIYYCNNIIAIVSL